ncbi:MAG: toprim domain-containing protein [archaeon]
MAGKIKELRMKLTEDDIKRIIGNFGVEPVRENEKEIVFPTVCHNLEGGSPKLYYYKKDKIFKCYTECNALFDIFDLLIKMKRLRGEEIGLRDAIKITGVEEETKPQSSETIEDLQYLKKLRKKKQDIIAPEEIEILDESRLNRYTFDLDGIKPWIDEGISEEALKKFNILYEPKLNAIVIPNYSHKGELIGIRGRFLNKDSKYKYMPLKQGDKILSHPTGKFFYGYYQNKETIRKKGVVIIFEGEKSVLKMETLFPGNNVGLSTSGKNITLNQLNELLKLEVNEIILAYDKDYRNKKEREEKIKEYEKTVSILKGYYNNVSLLIDYQNNLEYKDSPIDQGKEVFEKLIRYRIKR